MVRYEKGTKIICPNCDYEVSEALRDVHEHEIISHKPWRGVKSRDTFHCPKCQHLYLKKVPGSNAKVLHTDTGWR